MLLKKMLHQIKWNYGSTVVFYMYQNINLVSKCALIIHFLPNSSSSNWKRLHRRSRDTDNRKRSSGENAICVTVSWWDTSLCICFHVEVSLNTRIIIIQNKTTGMCVLAVCTYFDTLSPTLNHTVSIRYCIYSWAFNPIPITPCAYKTHFDSNNNKYFQALTQNVNIHQTDN
jgi:hypothetical protein